MNTRIKLMDVVDAAASTSYAVIGFATLTVVWNASWGSVGWRLLACYVVLRGAWLCAKEPVRDIKKRSR